MILVVLPERYNIDQEQNVSTPHRTVSKGYIIRNTMSFHNYTKKRNRLGTDL